MERKMRLEDIATRVILENQFSDDKKNEGSDDKFESQSQEREVKDPVAKTEDKSKPDSKSGFNPTHVDENAPYFQALCKDFDEHFSPEESKAIAKAAIAILTDSISFGKYMESVLAERNKHYGQ